MLCLGNLTSQHNQWVHGRDDPLADYSDRCRTARWEVTLWVDRRAPARVTEITAVACRPQQAHRITSLIRSNFLCALIARWRCDLPSVKILYEFLSPPSLASSQSINHFFLLVSECKALTDNSSPPLPVPAIPEGSAVRITSCTEYSGAGRV